MVGNFYLLQAFLELPINGTILVGVPKYAVRVSGVIRWGSPPQWAFPDAGKARIVWTDDQNEPLSGRRIQTPDDAVGVKGTVGGSPFLIEKILEVGENQIVYCFYSQKNNMRIAYGFDRRAVDAQIG